MFMRPTVLVAALGATLLSACTTGPRITEKSSGVQADVGAVVAQRPPTAGQPSGRVVGPAASEREAADAAAQARAVARYASRPFVGSRALAVTGEERLPPIFAQPVRMDFTDAANGMMPVERFFQRLSSASGVATRVSRDVWDQQPSAQPGQAPIPQGNSPQPQVMQPAMAPLPGLPQQQLLAQSAPPATGTIMPAQMPPQLMAAAVAQPMPSARSVLVDISPLKARGKLPTLLESLQFATDQLGISYTYQDGVIVVQRYVTEALELDFGGDSATDAVMKYTATGSSTSAGGGGGDSAGVQINQAIKMDMMASAVNAIREVVSKTPGSTVVATDFGRIMVTTTKDTMLRAREMVRQMQSTVNRRVAVNVDVYYLSSNDRDEKGFNWNVVFSSLSTVLGANLQAPTSLATQDAASLGFSIIQGGSSDTSRRLGNSNTVLNTLRSAGINAYVKSIPMVMANRTWGRDLKTDSQFFVSEISPGTTSVAGATAVPGVKMAQITTGDDVAVRARIMDSGRICLHLNASFGDLLGIDKANWGNSGYYTQQPRTSTAAAQREFCHDPGETVVLSGLSRRVATSNEASMGEGLPIGLGGSRVMTYIRQHMMIVVRATPV